MCYPGFILVQLLEEGLARIQTHSNLNFLKLAELGNLTSDDVFEVGRSKRLNKFVRSQN
jgi:hypothetical protein